MSRLMVRALVAGAAVAALLAHASPAQAVSPVYRVVGSCVTSPVVPASRHYVRIQDAVNASIASALPAIILVCPGTYPEQVVIGNSPDYEPTITLKGTNLTVGPAVIKAPDTGLVANYNSPNYGWIAAQLLVTDTKGITINNLEIDGRKSDGSIGGCPIGLDGNPALTAGIVFARAGDPETSFVEAGTIRYNSIHDQLPTFSACGSGSVGVIADNSFIKIDDNTITRVLDSGIAIFGGNAEVLRNAISYIGYTGIRVTAAHPYDISLNKISWVQGYGVVLENGTNNVVVEKNTFAPAMPVGVYLSGAHDNFVHANTIDGEDHIDNNWGGVFGGVFLDNGAANNLIEDNTIRHCVFACVMDRFSHGGNTIDWNNFVESHGFGVWFYSADADIPNTYSNKNTSVPVAVCNAAANSFDPNPSSCLP